MSSEFHRFTASGQIRAVLSACLQREFPTKTPQPKPSGIASCYAARVSNPRPKPEKRRGGVESLSVSDTVLIYAENRDDALDLELTVNDLLGEYGVKRLEDSRHEFTGSWFITFHVELSPNVERLVRDLKTVFGGKPSSKAAPKRKRSVMEVLESKLRK